MIPRRFVMALDPQPTDRHAAYGWSLAVRCAFEEIAAEEAKVRLNPGENAVSISVLRGAYVFWGSLCDSWLAAGFTFSSPPPGKAAVDHFHAIGVSELMAVGEVLTRTIKGALAAGLSWHLTARVTGVTLEDKPVPAPATPPGPQEIKIVGMPAVSIASLPDRETKTTIQRDADGAIVGSTAVEVDR